MGLVITTYLQYSYTPVPLLHMLTTHYLPHCTEAGCDEAGRGSYAGPVYAAAVILPTTYNHALLTDSKLCTPPQRLLLRDSIQANAISYAVAYCTVATITKLNILQAAIKAMHLALAKLATAPQHILVDGNQFVPYKSIPYTTIIKGDGTYTSIAAASILAKTYRDEHMNRLHLSYPEYDWLHNKGYGTLQHRQAIAKHGLCKHHRHSFNI